MVLKKQAVLRPFIFSVAWVQNGGMPPASGFVSRSSIHATPCPAADSSDGYIVGKVANRGDRSRGCYATPADFPLHDGTPHRGLRVRRWGLGFVHRSRAIFCRAVPTPKSYDSQRFHRCVW
jgi:hypothetical protein